MILDKENNAKNVGVFFHHKRQINNIPDTLFICHRIRKEGDDGLIINTNVRLFHHIGT